MRRFATLLAILLATVPALPAQHGHGGGFHGGARGAEHDGRPETGHRREGRADHYNPRSFGPELHRRVSRDDFRWVDGRGQLFFGGFWFECGYWPPWIFTDELFITYAAGDIYVVSDYYNPALQFQVRRVP